MEENQDKQEIKEDPYKRDSKGRLMPGTKGGPGRTKGKTMKEFAREFLMTMNNDRKKAFLNSLDPSIVWRMAEGNPANDLNVAGEIRLPLYLPTELLEKNEIPTLPPGTEPDSEGQPPLQSS